MIVARPAVDVDATNFIAVSEASKEALKTATLLRTLKVNALIQGESGVGKKTLARYILPEAVTVEGKKYDELLSVLRSEREVIVADIQNVANIKVALTLAKENGVRIIATALENFHDESIDEFFSVVFPIPPLRERYEDVIRLTEKFIGEAEHMLGEKIGLNLEEFTPDLSKNAISLKKQVLLGAILQEIGEYEVMHIMYTYLLDKLGSNNDYKKFLHLYEVPLIKAGLKRFKSQLQLADKLGLNRNTLRKKIQEHKEYLE